VRRSILLVLAVALAVLVFAPVATAQSDDTGQDDKGMHARGADDRGMDDRGFDDRGMDDRGFDDNATASPASTASAMGSASATSSATGSASASASPASSATSSATAAPSNVLPDTGGISLIPMLSAAVLALLISSGVIATVLARRAS
jgi:hypothetical protein